MNAEKKEVFRRYEDDLGEEYYCPIEKIADHHIVSERELDTCVEASTAERYSGNLNIADRNTG